MKEAALPSAKRQVMGKGWEGKGGFALFFLRSDFPLLFFSFLCLFYSSHFSFL